MRSFLTSPLIVIAGPKSSGKSERLIGYLEREVFAHRNRLAFKSANDKRTFQCVASQNQKQIPAIEVVNAIDILPHLSAGVACVGIDDAHFFEMDLVSVVCQLIASGKQVIVTGWDLDERAQPIEVMSHLLAFANLVEKQTAVCHVCHAHDATRTQRTVDKIDHDKIEHEPRCLRCFVSPP